MEKEKVHGHSFRIPMIELVIVIGVFAVISIFLVRMFLGTNRLMNHATDISHAVISAESVAEQIKNTASIGETANLLHMVAYDNTSLNYCIYYDKDWNQTVEPSEHIIIVTSSIEKKTSGRMVKAVIQAYACSTVTDSIDAEPLVELTTNRWVFSR